MSARNKNRDSFSILLKKADDDTDFMFYIESLIPAFWDRLADVFTEY